MLKMRVEFSKEELAALKASRIKPGISRAMKRAAATSLRDMRAEAQIRIRARKQLKVKTVKAAIVPKKNTGRQIEDMNWGIRLRGNAFRLIDYPHTQLKRGISVGVNKGAGRTKLVHAFKAKMKSGHIGIFQRNHPERRDIRELLGSRPADALLHDGEADAVSARGRASFFNTMERLLADELDKGGS